MLFAVKYSPRGSRTEAETQYVDQLASVWNPPSTTILHQYHYISGGGVAIVDIEGDVTPLHESLNPFRPFFDFDLEPALHMAEALAISMKVGEWKSSVMAGAENR